MPTNKTGGARKAETDAIFRRIVRRATVLLEKDDRRIDDPIEEMGAYILAAAMLACQVKVSQQNFLRNARDAYSVAAAPAKTISRIQ